jgi:hypothetical protein
MAVGRRSRIRNSQLDDNEIRGCIEMPENEEHVNKVSAMSFTPEAEVPLGRPTLLIEYFPPGTTVTSRDCVYEGQKYSKGSVVRQFDNKLYECTGDKDGSWKRVSD